MRPFSPRNYKTPVVHVARVPVKQDGEEEDTWPGDGTALLANVSQGTPQDRWGHQVEETVTGWVLWFGYRAVVDAGVTIQRGDQIRITPAHGAEIVLRVSAHATDYNQLGVSWMVQCQQVD